MKINTGMRVTLFGMMCFTLGVICGAYFSVNPISFGGSDAVCLDGAAPDKNGCCDGEIYTDMGEHGWNCCPEGNGDCFPPLR